MHESQYICYILDQNKRAVNFSRCLCCRLATDATGSPIRAKSGRKDLRLDAATDLKTGTRHRASFPKALWCLKKLRLKQWTLLLPKIPLVFPRTFPEFMKIPSLACWRHKVLMTLSFCCRICFYPVHVETK